MTTHNPKIISIEVISSQSRVSVIVDGTTVSKLMYVKRNIVCCTEVSFASDSGR